MFGLCPVFVVATVLSALKSFKTRHIFVPVPISQQLDFQLHLIVVFLMFINLR
jgi:hypothetical protein